MAVENMILELLVKHHGSDGDVEVFVTSGRQATLRFRNPVKHTELDVNMIFERFYTADHSRGSSTGLGLSIVKLLAEQLDGSTSASLKAGVLEITVELPLDVHSP